jgi:alkylation response protein AidB-like acyl-CoA dehydrogenase
MIYAKQREQFGQPIANFQMIQEKLARMATKVEAAKAMVWSQAIEMDEKGPSGMALETAASKLFASETAVENALDATQIFGGYGYTREFPVERYLRDSRVLTIGAGTSEIMCYIIFKQLDKKFGGSA